MATATTTNVTAEQAEALAHLPEVQHAALSLRPENFDRWLANNLPRLLRQAA